MRTITFLIIAMTSLQLMCSSNTANNASTEMTIPQILKAIEKGENIHLKGKVIKGDLDFTSLEGILANTNYHTISVDAALTFEDCTFEGEVIAYSNKKEVQRVCHFLKGVHFINCTFKEEVNFKGATIQGLANFSKSYFEKEVHFEACHFQSEGNFKNTIYMKDMYFQQARFSRASNFLESNIGGIANFQGCKFDDNVQFGVCEFHEYADFSLVIFNEGCFADYAKFHHQAVFSNATFRGRAEFKSCEHDKQASFKGSTFYGKVRFNESIYRDVLNLSKTRFIYEAPESGGIKMENKSLIQLEGAKYNNFQPIDLQQF